MEKNFKCGVVFFHKNVHKIYKPGWVDKSIRSMLNQNFQNFVIYEIDYSGSDLSLIEKYNPTQKHNFFSLNLENHGLAMNYILDKAFSDGCDYVFNTNLDDYYSRFRIEKQLEELKNGSSIVSSNFYYIYENDGQDTIIYKKDMSSFSDSISEQLLEKNHNIICHPVVAYSRKFWEKNRYIPDEIPEEDFKLWKRALLNGEKITILEDYLLHYRLHENQVTGNNSQMKNSILNKGTSTEKEHEISNKSTSDPTRLL